MRLVYSQLHPMPSLRETQTFNTDMSKEDQGTNDRDFTLASLPSGGSDGNVVSLRMTLSSIFVPECSRADNKLTDGSTCLFMLALSAQHIVNGRESCTNHDVKPGIPSMFGLRSDCSR